MKIHNWLKTSTKRLEESAVSSARLDCLILLCDALNKDKSYVLAHLEDQLPKELVDDLNKKISRRVKNVPLAYIRGKTEFYGLEIAINEHVLVPRPESENIINLVKDLENIEQIIDIGTGSGCLAIATKYHLPKIKVIAIDKYPECLKLAKINSIIQNLDITFIKSDLLNNIDNVNFTNTVIIANLPYVPNELEINEAAKYEPSQAIFGGQSGLELYLELFEQIDQIKIKPEYVITESLLFQHPELVSIANNFGYKLSKKDGLVQVFHLNFD